jgi:hypothetical protein
VRESNVLTRARLAASRLGMKLFRNNSGGFKDDRGTWIRYGVASPGGSDLIGWYPYQIESRDVGRTVAVFVALETKSTRGRATKEQINFIERVRDDGGIAEIIRSDEDVAIIIQLWKPGSTA